MITMPFRPHCSLSGASTDRIARTGAPRLLPSQAQPRQHKQVAEEPDCVVDEALSAPQRHVAQSLGIEAGESSWPRRAKLFRVPFCGLRLLAHWAFAPAFSVRGGACSDFIGGNSSTASRPSS